jgi:glycosyltransferase involved in cell wall biosynthesis
MKFDTAVRETIREKLEKIGRVDVVVGIPCYNEEETIAHIVSNVGQGLQKYLPGKKSLIVVSDGGSLDDTRENAESVPVPEGINRIVSIYRGIAGKGTAFRAIFETATMMGAEACVVVDSDLESIAPDWVKLLAQPILERRAGFVAPYYRRHKYDGTITNHIAYPITRALYGIQLRQPIGGEFGLSSDLVASLVTQDVWKTDVTRFGIDIWMSTEAIVQKEKIVQTDLGKKVHQVKDPSTDLGAMFEQVVSTLFYVACKYRNLWMRNGESRPVEISGKSESDTNLRPVPVSMEKLRREFTEGFEHFQGFYERNLSPKCCSDLVKVKDKTRKGEKTSLDPTLWAKILYEFLYIYSKWERNRRRLIEMLAPLYFGRVTAYCEEVAGLQDGDEEQVIEKQAQQFEKQKPYLLRLFENSSNT